MASSGTLNDRTPRILSGDPTTALGAATKQYVDKNSGTVGNVLFSNTNKASFPLQGVSVTWNQSGGNGEADFINNQGGGIGGYSWYNTSGAGTALTLILSVSAAGNLNVPGQIVTKNGADVTCATNGRIFLASSGSSPAIFFVNAANSAFVPGVITSSGLAFRGGLCSFDSGISPATDGGGNCGNSAQRWTTVYAVTGAINTSDAREKTAVQPLTPAEIAAAKSLADEIGTYQWLASVADKGSDARQHVGLTVQRAMALMQAQGLDPMRYGFICYDAWEMIPGIPATEAVAEVVDEQGNVTTPAVLAFAGHPDTPAGDRYGFRYDELMAFIARGISARLSAVEQQIARLTAGATKK